MNDLLTVAEAAKIAEVCPSTIQYWIKTGRLKERRAPRSAHAMKARPREVMQKLMVDRQELIAATPDGIEAAVRRANPTKRLLNLRDIQRILGVQFTTAWAMVNSTGVHKYPLYGNTYLVDGEELYEALEDSSQFSIYVHAAKMRGLTI